MNCKDVRAHFFDLVSGEPVPAQVVGHVPSCPECARELESLRSTLATLDEWKAPDDVSPYFMTRLMARVREEKPAPESKWFLAWVRKPALAASMAAVLIAAGGVGLLHEGSTNPGVQQARIQVDSQARVGTAVSDLQYLEGHNDLLAEFELLDDMSSN
jgi:anti-sigma factor RsiW